MASDIIFCWAVATRGGLGRCIMVRVVFLVWFALCDLSTTCCFGAAIFTRTVGCHFLLVSRFCFFFCLCVVRPVVRLFCQHRDERRLPLACLYLWLLSFWLWLWLSSLLFLLPASSGLRVQW